MDNLQEERALIQIMKNKLSSGRQFSTDELSSLIGQFEDTVDLASVSMKIIDRMRVNYSHLRATPQNATASAKSAIR